MVSLLVIGLLLLLLGLLLVLPIIIRLDTQENTFDMRMPGVFHSWLGIDQLGLVIHIWLPVYQFKIHPFQASTPKQASQKKKKRSRKGSRVRIKSALNMIRSFRCDLLEVVIDTDDYILNAQLVPVGQLLSRGNLSIFVNFRGVNSSKIQIRNTLWRLGMAFFSIKRY